MSYMRQFNRKSERIYYRHGYAVRDRTALYRKVLYSVTALGFFFVPAAMAQNITAVTGSGTNVAVNGNVTQVTTTNVVQDKIGVNKFTKFELDANHIANLYMAKASTGAEVNDLVNLVGSRIDVKGTVNAVKNNTIGGNLYFLSSDGMAVGKTGVINAGTLTVLTPTSGAMDKLMKDNGTIANMVDKPSEVALNETGTITVLGKINATDGITMRAAKIGIGKNVTDTDYDGVAAGATVQGTKVTTGVTDFSNLVNTDNTNAQLGNTLIATQSGSGDIVLAAYNNYNDHYTAASEFKSATGETVTAALDVGQGTEITTGSGAIKLSATALNNVTVSKYSTSGTTGTNSTNNHLFGQMVTTNAKVNMDGIITGNSVDLTADAENTYISANGGLMSTGVVSANELISDVLGAFSANESASYAKLSSSAEVAIGSQAAITATGADTTTTGSVLTKALNITAKSNVTAGTGASGALFKLDNIGPSSLIPGNSVTVAITDNTAKVGIDGTINVNQGGANIQALADSSLSAAATAKSFDVSTDPALVNVAVTVASGSNNSSVEVNNDIKVNQDLLINSQSDNAVNTSATGGTSSSGVLATAVNVTAYDSTAKTTINKNVQSTAGNVDISAANDMSENTVTANNAVGYTTWLDSLGSVFPKSINMLVGQNSIFSKFETTLNNSAKTPAFIKALINEKETPQPWEKLGELLSLGVAVDWADESNKSNVTIGNNAAVQAAKDLNIAANTTIDDTHMKATGSSGAAEKGTKNLINASLLVAGIDNDASVVVKGATAADKKNNVYAQLKGQNVQVTSKANFAYGRTTKMLATLHNIIDNFRHSSIKSKPEDFKKVFALQMALNDYEDYVSKNPDKVNSGEALESDEFKSLTAAANDLAASSTLTDLDTSDATKIWEAAQTTIKTPLSLVGLFKEVIDPTSYANFTAASSTSGKTATGTGNDTTATTLGIAGSVSRTSVANNARVLVGENAAISGTDLVNLSANSSAADVTLNGKLAFSMSQGAADQIGGILGFNFADTNSLVAVAQDAAISGGALRFQADNTINHYIASVGAGKGGDVGFTGMLAYVGGDSNSIVSIDDEAILTARKASGSTITAGTNDGSIVLAANNKTNVATASGDVAVGTKTGAGIALGIVQVERNTYAAIADNDMTSSSTGSTETDTTTELGDRTKNAEKLKKAGANAVTSLRTLVHDQSALSASDQASLFGSDNTTSTGAVNASSLQTTANTSGVIVAATVAGGVTSGDDGQPAEKKKDASSKLKFITDLGKKVKTNIGNLDDNITGKLKKWFPSTVPDQPVGQKGNNNLTHQDLPSLSIDAAGSSSVNLLTGTTAALLNNANITIANDTTSMQDTVGVQASDSSILAAVSGAGAISWKNQTAEKDQSNMSVGVAGAVGVNVVNMTTLSLIRNSTIENADAVTNRADKSGVVVAGGIGLSLSKDAEKAGTTNAAGAASVSVNDVNNTVYALMENDAINAAATTGTDTRATAVTNKAYDTDVQVTGGVSVGLVSGGNKGVAIGGTVAYGSLTNDVQAVLLKGQYDHLTTTDVQALTNMTEVGVAVGVGVSTASKTSYGFAGAAAYNRLDNYAFAGAEDVTLSGQSLIVAAHDTTDKVNDNLSYLADRGFDTSGDGYMGNIGNSVNDIQGTDATKVTVDTSRKGNVIVTGALSVAASTAAGGGDADAAISVSDIDNDFAASVTGSTITTTGPTKSGTETVADTNVTASSNTILAGFAAGAAATKGKAGVGGSVNWQTLGNDVTAAIQNSTVTAPRTDVTALSGAKAVSLAGQLSLGSKVGTGFGMAYNALRNTTGAYVRGSTIETSAADGADLRVQAANAGQVYAVGAAVAGSNQVAVNGLVVVNRGRDDVEAAVEGYSYDDAGTTKTKASTLDNINNLQVDSSDSSDQLAVAGSLSVAKKGTAAVGGVVAFNEIGSLYDEASGKQQKNQAVLSDTDMTTTADGVVQVGASDTSTLTTVAVGSSLAVGTSDAGVAVQGTAATALIDKMTAVSINKVNVNQSGPEQGKLSAKADSADTITTVSVVAAGSGADAIGAAVGVNRINQDTSANLADGTLKLANADIRALSAADITAVGVGGSGGGTAGITGSFAINYIGNDTTAHIGDSAAMTTVDSIGNLGLVAQSDEEIANYAGVFSGAGTTAVGLSVSVNTISGNTDASIENSSLTAQGSDADLIQTVSGMKESAIISNAVSKAEFTATALKDGRQALAANGERGLVVDSSATHSISSALFTIGGSGTGAGMGTVNVNHIGGSTTATVNKSDINKNLTDLTKADTVVRAADYTNSGTFTGTVAGAGTAAVGLASDTNIVSRDTKALLAGTATVKGAAKAHNLAVTATAAQGLSNFDINAAGSGAASVAGTVIVDKLGGTTAASVQLMNVDYTKTAKVTAAHNGGAYLADGTAGASGTVGVGLTVGVVKETAAVKADVTDSTLQSTTVASTAVVSAANTTKLFSALTSAGVGLSAVGVGGTVMVNNLNNTVAATVTDSEVTAGTVAVTAKDMTMASASGGALGGGMYGGIGTSVAVNTFDSSVNTSITNSTLSGKQGGVTVSAETDRDTDQFVITPMAGFAALGANVMVTHVNSAITDENALTKIQEAEDAHVDNSGNIIGLTDEEKTQVQTETVVDAGTGGNNAAAGTHTAMTAATIDAGTGDAAIQAIEKSDATMIGGSVAAGAASIDGAVSILNVKHATDTTLVASTVTGNAVTVQAAQQDYSQGTRVNVYQGSVGLGLGAAYGEANTSGTTAVSLTDTDITAASAMTINGSDTSTTAVNAYGLDVGAITAGAIVARAKNESAVQVLLDSTADHRLQTTQNGSSLAIGATKQNVLSLYALGGSLGVLSGTGIDAEAKDSGSATVQMKGSHYTLQAPTISLSADTIPQAALWAGAGAAGLGNVQVTLGQAVIDGASSLILAEGNSFNGDDVTFRSGFGGADKTTADVIVQGGTITAAGGLENQAEADTAAQVNIAVGNENYKGFNGTAGATKLTVSGTNYASRAASIADLNVGALLAVGNVKSITSGQDTVRVGAGGGTVQSLDLQAVGESSGDAYADGQGGGLIAISPKGAVADNTLATAAKASLSGTWIAQSINVKARQKDIADMYATTSNGGGVDVTGAEAKTTISSADAEGTLASIADNAKITAATVDVQAANEITTGRTYDYSVDGNVYGIAATNLVDALQNIDKASTVNIGQAVITSSGKQNYTAYTTGNLVNKVCAYAGGASSEASTDNQNTTTVTNTVRTAGNLLNSGAYDAGGITLAAYDRLNSDTRSDAISSKGVDGAISANTTNHMTRNNTVDVTGLASSAQDLNIYAGTDTKGASGSLTMYASANAYNHTLIPIRQKPTLDVTIQENDHVLISGNAQAVRHINMTADSGEDAITLENATYSWIKGNDVNNTEYSTNTAGDTKYTGETKDNFVQVDGTLEAGMHNNINVELSGTIVPVSLVLSDGKQGKLDVSVTDAKGQHLTDLEGKITTATMNYANQLAERWNTLTTLIESYAGKQPSGDDLTVYVSYVQEKERLEAEMKSLNLLEAYVNTAGVTVYIPVTEGYDVITAQLPDLSASGGNITVHTDTLKGQGTLAANGAPALTVTNTSSVYLITDNIKIGAKGGEVIFHDMSIGSGDNAQINELNTNKDAGSQAAFGSIHTDDSSSAGAGIQLTNEYRGGDIAVTDTKTGTSGAYHPLSTVEISGLIDNPQGQVSIINKSGSIVIDKASTDKPVGVNGKSVRITATGEIDQGYTAGIVNIGGTPEDEYAALAKETREGTKTYAQTFSSNPTAEHDVIANSAAGVTAKGGSYIAGGNIYMAASGINVNGTIQSGYGKYYADIPADALSEANVSQYKNNGAVTIDNHVMYKVNDGGRAVLQSDGSYAYEVQVYYDALNKKLVVEDIDSQGGKIYLTGRIASTGNGKILALDGGAAITINNESSGTLDVGKVLNNDIDGKIVITDTNLDQQVTYTRTGTATITDYSKWLSAQSEAEKRKYESSGAASASYTPQKDLRYNWSEGTKSGYTTTYDWHSKKFLDLINFSGSKLISKIKPDSTATTQFDNAEPLPTGAYLDKVAEAKEVYTLIADSEPSAEVVSPVATWTKWHGLNKDHYAQWTESTAAKQTYVNSLKADNPISIGFVGSDTGSIAISGGGDVNLKGNILSNTAAAALTVKAGKDMSQQEGTTLKTNNAVLTAGSGINNIDITSMGTQADDTVKLTAVTTVGQIDINVNSGFRDNANLPGNVEIERLATLGSNYTANGTSQNIPAGRVSLQADGNITQAGTDLTVQGSYISLTSRNGAIGTANQAVLVQGGQEAEGDDSLSASVNASAQGNINLSQHSGNMRVGTIVSKNGDVRLTASDGAFIDALPDSNTLNSTETDQLIQNWIDVGLIAGTEHNQYKEQLSQAVSAYETKATKDFATYQSLKTYYDANPTVAESTVYQALKAQFGSAADAASWLAEEKTNSYSDYAALINKRDNPQYEWTQNQLLYSVKDILTNKTTGSTDTEKKIANVSGNNVTLLAKAVGTDKEAETISAADLADNTANLKKLANAEAADVTVTKETATYEYIDASGQKQTGTYDYVTQFTIGGKVPLGVNTTGVLQVATTGDGNAYVAGRSDDKDNYAALNVDSINTGDGNIRLLGKAGVYNARSDTGTNFQGHDLIIEGGSTATAAGKTADIGTAAKAVTVDLSGDLTARTAGSMYMKNNAANAAAVLKLGAMYAGDTINLMSAQGLVMGSNGDAYLNAGNLINLTTDGGPVGTSAEALRILANGAAVNVYGADNVYLAGKLGIRPAADSTLILGTIETAGTVQANSDGSLQVGRAEVKDGNTVVITAVPGKVKSGTDVDLSAKGNITLKGPVTADTDINVTADNGTIALQKDIAAGQNLNMSAHNGSILFNGADTGATEDITATAAQGNVNITVTGTGDIKDSHRLVNGDRGFVQAPNGNAIIDNQGTGIIDRYGLLAKDKAAASTADGDIYLHEVNGNLVALIVKNGDKGMYVDDMVAGQSIDLTGSTIDVQRVSQRDGSSQPLGISFRGSDGQGVNYLHIGDIYSPYGVTFPRLWINNGSITVSHGDFTIDKLYVGGKATFSNGTMTTNVFGRAPEQEAGISSAYWMDGRINKPGDYLTQWLASGNNGQWMYLRFAGQSHRQYSDGLLLSLEPYYYVYNQRFTAQDQSRLLEDADTNAFHGDHYDAQLPFYDRYNLIGSSGLNVANANAQEIKVE